MDVPGGAGSSAGGAVVVPVGRVEAAAPAAPAAAGGSAWTRVLASVAMAGAAAAAAARPAWTRLSRRLAWAAALFLLGLAAAGLAIFAMILPLAEQEYSRHCVLVREGRLRRAASGYLLLAAAAQVLVVPARPVAAFGWLLGWLTAYRAADVLWMMLVACHGAAHGGALAFHFWLFFFVMCAALLVGAVVVSIR